jgi:glycerophosphoryl diester phosphodiesterase
LSSTCPEPRNSRGRTRIIAHRGASGYLPEHTSIAKALAYGLGADFIEQDLIATKDHQLVVLHDVYLNDVSDVAARFPDRRQDDGRFYVVDFTFAELQELTLSERRNAESEALRFPGRFPYRLPGLRVVRFEDELLLISGLNASTGRHVGIYPEIKEPRWHSERGIDLTRLVHDTLEAHRETISGPVFVQSFDEGALRRFKEEFASTFPLVQLLERRDAERLAGRQRRRARIAEYAAGVGLPFETLIEDELLEGRAQATELAEKLSESGLLVHPYTLRRDVAPAGEVGYFDSLRFLIHDLRVDALFCDHPDDALTVRDYNAA